MLTLRPATRADVPIILSLIHGLAEYERAPNAVVATEADLLRDGFDSPAPKFRVIIAEWDGAPVGMAFYFFNYSTWLGKPGLYLEDLFVTPDFRSRGIGLALFRELARIAIRENCYGLRWQVLDWNTPAVNFYEALGAEHMKEWWTMRLTGRSLQKLADQPIAMVNK
jgi:GNAT superfamily N-acetyltransferase